MSKEKISGSEALMRSLEHEGVKTLFGYPGGSHHAANHDQHACGRGGRHQIGRASCRERV